MLGLKRGTVMLVPHQEEWRGEAQRVIALLQQILGGTVRDIQHVGSTAISQIQAKPILDLALAMDDPEQILVFLPQLEQRGILLRGKDHEGLLLVMGDPAADTRTCHIHVVAYGSEVWSDYVNFRDYLSAHPKQAREYEACKQELAQRYAGQRERYTQGKAPLIAQILEQARQWRTQQKG